MRTILKLTEKTKRHLDRQDLVADLNDNNPVLLQPIFFGIGLDLNKVWSGLKGRFNGLSKLEPEAKRFLANEYARGKRAASWLKKAIERLRGEKP